MCHLASIVSWVALNAYPRPAPHVGGARLRVRRAVDTIPAVGQPNPKATGSDMDPTSSACAVAAAQRKSLLFAKHHGSVALADGGSEGAGRGHPWDRVLAEAV